MRRWILLSISLIWCSSTLAAISVTGLGSLDLGTWDPSLGPISSSIDFCVASTSGASGNPRDYDAQLDQVAATTPFELISLGSPSETIATTVGFVDLLASAAETLTPGVATAQDKTGVAAT